MNHALLLLFLSAFTLSACSDDDNDGNSTPISQLPPATQVGANTFGCLVNGEAFLPSGSGFGGPVLDCFYQFVDGGFYFSLKARRYKNSVLQGISIGTNNKQISENIFSLKENIIGNSTAGWWNNESFSFIYTNQNYSGELKITKLDEIQHIVSGTFWFDIQQPDGEIIEIREGRFDMQYTN